MREEIAYKEMQEELAQERGSPPPSPDPTMKGKASPSAADPGGETDPTRKQRAYPHLPSDGDEP
ncbi:MAG TPA: hypothetical protein VK066_22090 [Chloroflexota bacterium]|nr:hypothetical protein [Chloroflexota bacterium]